MKVHVRSIRLAANIGAHAHEKGRLQTLTVDVTLEIDAPSKDSLSATVDYNAVVQHAEALANTPIELIETFSICLAKLCLQNPLVSSATVRTMKPSALVNGIAETEASLSRDSLDNT